MHKTKNDLPEKIRTQVVTVLQERLAEAVDLVTQAKQAHWNVKGRTSSRSTNSLTKSWRRVDAHGQAKD